LVSIIEVDTLTEDSLKGLFPESQIFQHKTPPVKNKSGPAPLLPALKSIGPPLAVSLVFPQAE
jgi:hypothetical protein